MSRYTVATPRLGLRNWIESDIRPFVELCQDHEVMKHFPKCLSEDDVVAAVNSFQEHFAEHGFTYFAVELRETNEFIGFVGLKHQTYESPYTPCVDIGWRLKQSAWGMGYATEAAKSCLEFAFNQLQLEEVLSVCAHTNAASEAVMTKIGMIKIGSFDHPAIPEDSHLNPCVAYRIGNDQFHSTQ